MLLELSTQKDTITACLMGDIDHHTAKELRQNIDEEINKRRPKVLKLDFKKVDFMDSSGIGLIMGRYKLINTMGGDLQVINVPKYIDRVFRLSGLEQLGVLEKKIGGKRNETV